MHILLDIWPNPNGKLVINGNEGNNNKAAAAAKPTDEVANKSDKSAGWLTGWLAM